jgi:hypothetical protein
MIGLYYRIWVDCIKRAKSQPTSKRDWALGSMFYMSIAMISNFALFMAILQRNVLHSYFYKVRFSFLSGPVNILVTYVFLIIAPCIIMNYLLIFRNKRYEKLLEKYPYYDGKLFVSYFLISLLLPIVLLWIGIFFFSN